MYILSFETMLCDILSMTTCASMRWPPQPPGATTPTHAHSSGTVTVCANGRGQADAEARNKAAAGAWARARSWLQSGAGGALSCALMVGCGLAAYELLLRRGAARLGAGAPHGPGDLLGLGSGLAADGGMAVVTATVRPCCAFRAVALSAAARRGEPMAEAACKLDLPACRI